MKKINNKKYRILQVVSKYSFVFIIIFSILMPVVFVGAADPSVAPGIDNPLGSAGPQNIPDFIVAVINIVLVIGIPILVLALIYAGFLYVKAQGNPGELETAHRTLLYTIIGGFLLLGSFVIAKAIGQTVNDIKSTT